MLQFYIPEVVSVEQIFDEADDMQVKTFSLVREKIVEILFRQATELKKLEEKLKKEEE